MWGPPAASLDPVTVSVEVINNTANGGFGTRRLVKSDTSVGATRVAHVHFKPLKSTPAACWQNVMAGTSTTNGVALTLNGPDNTIVDLVLNCVLQNGETPFTAITTTGMTAGVLYGAQLDGAPAGLLEPVGLLPIP